jgi:hypothetical protein
MKSLRAVVVGRCASVAKCYLPLLPDTQFGFSRAQCRLSAAPQPGVLEEAESGSESGEVAIPKLETTRLTRRSFYNRE